MFVTIHRKLAWLKDPALFRPWAYRIASRQAFKALRRERRLSGHLRDDIAPETVPADDPPSLDPRTVSRLVELVEVLPPRSRAAITLHYLQELSLQEVADVLEVPVGTVKSRVAYGLAQMRSAWERQSPEGRSS